jgi:hypothetical protein
VIALANFPLMSSPAMVTSLALSALTWAMNSEYGSSTIGSAGFIKVHAFQARKPNRKIHHKRLHPDITGLG